MVQMLLGVLILFVMLFASGRQVESSKGEAQKVFATHQN